MLSIIYYALQCYIIVNGWLNAGDIGYKDKNSYLYTISHEDDMINKRQYEYLS
jgi:long-subunit acyl-CoA synthetase (AMP-forming)